MSRVWLMYIFVWAQYANKIKTNDRHSQNHQEFATHVIQLTSCLAGELEVTSQSFWIRKASSMTGWVKRQWKKKQVEFPDDILGWSLGTGIEKGKPRSSTCILKI